jgi:outer membrane protein assembly factor BamB
LWKRGRYGHGQLLLVGDLLLVQAENGEVVLVEASGEEHRELGRFTALSGKTWNPPALSGDLLLVRNDQEAAAFRLPLAR